MLILTTSPGRRSGRLDLAIHHTVRNLHLVFIGTWRQKVRLKEADAMSDAGEINHDDTSLALHVGNSHRIAITRVELVQQGNRVMVITKAQGFSRLQRASCSFR